MKQLLLCISVAFLFSIGVSSAWAHSVTLDVSELALGSHYSEDHDETGQDEWAGWVYVSVQNTGTEAWGDFHFNIYEVPGGSSVENVDWDVINHTPTSSQDFLTWSVNNDDPNGATIDLYFYDDPVLPDEIATFQVYNVNPDHSSFFGVTVFPSPVPVPAAAWLLGSGLLGLIGFRRKK